MKKENRSNSRFNFSLLNHNMKVFYKMPKYERWNECELYNLCFQGAGLKLPQIMSKDDRLDIKINDEKNMVFLKGNVVHMSGRVTGIAFEELSGNQEKFLEALFISARNNTLKNFKNISLDYIHR